jgi:dTDP-glucose 4,6-dehydratase
MVQVSTDEVYGSIEKGSFKESDPLNPSSPYSASKAGGDLMCLAYYKTWGVPVMITRGSNTFGPYQYPEKVIPLFITNAIDNQPLPLYGDGMNVRDWLYVLDHCEAIDLVLHEGKPGEIYNVGAGNELTNLELTRLILKILRKPESLIRFVEDRPGHDRRYSLDCTKIKALGWQPRHKFEEALEETVRWYVENQWWWRKIKSGQYMEFYRKQYEKRLATGKPFNS